MIYSIVDGPGTIDSMTGAWSWIDPSIEDVGQEVWVTIGAKQPQGLTLMTTQVQLEVTNDAPQFTQGCERTIFVSAYIENVIQFEAEDSCPGDSVVMEVLDHGGLAGDIWFEGFALHYLYNPVDLGTYTVWVGVSDGYDAGAACYVELKKTACRSCGCCGIYSGGFSGNFDFDDEGRRNLADITRLIDFVYISKNPPVCLDNGNTNGDIDGMVNLADITRLIDHVYVSKQQTAPCQ